MIGESILLKTHLPVLTFESFRHSDCTSPFRGRSPKAVALRDLRVLPAVNRVVAEHEPSRFSGGLLPLLGFRGPSHHAGRGARRRAWRFFPKHVFGSINPRSAGRTKCAAATWDHTKKQSYHVQMGTPLLSAKSVDGASRVEMFLL